MARYEIWQLKDGDENHYYRFESWNGLKRYGMKFEPDRYKKVYEGDKNGMTLEEIYRKFNIEHPADFCGHSLSVSDLVVFDGDGERKTYYVDSYGFKDVSEYMTGK